MLPVMSARLLIALTVSVPLVLAFTPIVKAMVWFSTLKPGRSIDRLGRQSGNRGRVGRGRAPTCRSASKPVVCRSMCLRSVEAVFNDDVDQGVDEREIARADRQMQIREHRRLRDARIDHDHGLVGIRLQAAAQDRVVVGDVRADQQDEIGNFDLHAPLGTVAAERSLVAATAVDMHSVVRAVVFGVPMPNCTSFPSV